MPKIILILKIINNQLPTTTSSRPDVFCKKGVLRNFAKITGKQLCQSLCFNKVADQACNFIKIETLAQVFSCEFGEISRNTFFSLHLRETASVLKYSEKRYGFNLGVHKAIKVSCLLGSKIPITYKHNLEAAVRRYS